MTAKAFPTTYDEFYTSGKLKKRWDWGSSPRMYFEYAENGTVTMSREFTPAESDIADARIAADDYAAARAALVQQLSDGIADIQAAITSANNDAGTAQGLQAGALSIKNDATTQRVQIATFVPAASYQQAQLAAVKQQIDALAARDETFAQAFNELFVWRQNVDLFMVKSYNATLWLAQVISGRMDN